MAWMKGIVVVAAIAAGIANVAVCVAQEGAGRPKEQAPQVWESTYTKTAPTLDGKLEDVWQTAKPITVVVRKALGGDRARPVALRALHTDDTFYMAAQWPDETKSDLRDPYVWNAAQNVYERPTRPDDQFAIEFPLEGHFDLNMLSLAHRYVADLWHWKAGRGNPIGWVDDKRHLISQEPIPKAAEYSMGGHGKVYIARPVDEGTTAYKVKPAPTTFQGEVVDSIEQVEPTGSLADVRAKGVHDGKTWTLEMSRKFNTGHNDDAVLDPGKDNLCAIAVLDDELYWEHSVSTVITLRFADGSPKGGAK